MTNLKQHLVEEMVAEIASKEKELKASSEELKILKARLKIEKKILEMQDVPENLMEQFTYSMRALEDMLSMETERNLELNRDFEMLTYRRRVIESQFSEGELDR